MKIRRTLPPTAAPLHILDILNGFAGFFFGEKYLKKLKNELQEHFDVKHVFLVSSGKAALTIILNALNTIDSRNEVLIPAYTCYSVPAAIIKAGLKVSLCDIEPQTFDFNYNLLKNKIQKDTLCIIPSNLFGIPSDIDKIKCLCEGSGIYIIEDAAQAMGGIYKGKMIGTIGDVGFFSLGRGKNITSGAGGIIITNSDKIADVIEKNISKLKRPNFFDNLTDYLNIIFMSIFIHPFLYWLPSGLPFLKLGETIFPDNYSIKKLSGVKAGILFNWKNNLIESNRIRKVNTAYFRKYISLAIPCLRIPIIIENRNIHETILNISNKQGMGIGKMYPKPINEIDEIKSIFNGTIYPIAKVVAQRLLTIPTHHLTNEHDRERIKKLLDSKINNSDCYKS